MKEILMPQSDFWPFSSSKIKYTNATKEESASESLQKQIGEMEGEVKEMQMELEAIKKERIDLCGHKQVKPNDRANEDIFSRSSPPETSKHTENSEKLSEVENLRQELLRAKSAAVEERYQREKYECRLKDLESKLNNICSLGIKSEKELRKSSSTEVTGLKTQLRDMREEMEELKISLADKTDQLQEYRVKYLQAQQQVEELKRQLDIIDYDNKQVSDHIQIEIQKMKMQFQEKLQELSPLPDLLKGAQLQLQEAKQMQRLAEENFQQISCELIRVKEKLVAAVNSLNQERAEKSLLQDENKILKFTLEEKTKELEAENSSLNDFRCQVLRLQEKLNQQELRFTEKSNEYGELAKDLEELRVESNRSLVRSKERFESMRRYMQTQISELERQLIQTRAQCRACQKERDEIRQRMQIQINNLQENFELGEIRLRALLTQVTSLKNNYSAVLADEEDGELNKIVTATNVN